MTIHDLETEALKLKPEARAKLARTLLESLEVLSDEELENLWAEEAVRRNLEMDAGKAPRRSAEDAFKQAKAWRR